MLVCWFTCFEHCFYSDLAAENKDTDQHSVTWQLFVDHDLKELHRPQFEKHLYYVKVYEKCLNGCFLMSCLLQVR